MERGDFIAIDVETANADSSSICQIGMVAFQCGAVHSVWRTYVNPEDEFDAMNIEIHGITPAMVANAPTIPTVYTQVKDVLNGQTAVCHTAFDRIAFARAAERYGLPPLSCRWIDTARVTRRTWSDFAYRGYGLASITEHLGIEFRHHDAAEDARAAGEVLLRAMTETGMTVDECFKRAGQPLWIGEEAPTIAREGQPDGPLAGETIVFTGALGISRQTAADKAAEAGCDVGENVTKKTTLLVVGNQDVRRLNGQEKSSKHRKAEELIRAGRQIRILSEADFIQLVDGDWDCYEDRPPAPLRREPIVIEIDLSAIIAAAQDRASAPVAAPVVAPSAPERKWSWLDRLLGRK